MTTISLPFSMIDTARAGRWHVLAGALIIQGILGTIYGYSVFWQPLEARLFPPVMIGTAISSDEVLNGPVTIAADETESSAIHAAQQNRLKFGFGICLFCFALSMIFAGQVQDSKGPRFVSICGAVCLALGFLLAGQSAYVATFYAAHAILSGALVVMALLLDRTLISGMQGQRRDHARWVLFGSLAAALTFGVMLGNRYITGNLEDRIFLLWAAIGALAGTGIGFAYVAPIAALVKWFPGQKGLMSGVAVAGFGMGALIFSSRAGFGAAGFIERHGIDLFFNVHAIVCLLGISAGAMLLRNPPIEFMKANAAGATGRLPPPALDVTWREVLRSAKFYLIWIMFFSGALAGLMVIGILKPFAGSQLLAAAMTSGRSISTGEEKELLMLGAKAIGWLAIFNALGRVFWGLASDRFGHRLALTAMFVLQMAMLMVLQQLDTQWGLAVGAAWVGFNFGGNFSLFPSLTAGLFGTRNLGANYGWVFTAYGAAGLLGIVLGNTAIGQTGSYAIAFKIAAAMCLLSAILAATLPLKRKESLAGTSM